MYVAYVLCMWHMFLYVAYTPPPPYPPTPHNPHTPLPHHHQIRAAACRLNPNAQVVEVNSEVVVDHPELVSGKRVLCVEDGPTLTHGGMPYGAGQVFVYHLQSNTSLQPLTPTPHSNPSFQPLIATPHS